MGSMWDSLRFEIEQKKACAGFLEMLGACCHAWFGWGWLLASASNMVTTIELENDIGFGKSGER